MSTRCVVGHLDENNNLEAVYCHYDGYPEYMVPTLDALAVKFGSKGILDMILNAQVNGGLRVITDKSFETFQEPSLKSKWSYTHDEIKRGYGHQYGYIIDSSGRIVEFYADGELQPLKSLRKFKEQ